MIDNKIKTYGFVGLFDETRRAGDAFYEMPGKLGGMDREVIPVFSRVMGLYSPEMMMLLIRSTVESRSTIRFESGGDVTNPTVAIVIAPDVTTCVRDLPRIADEWHAKIRGMVETDYPEMNRPAERPGAINAAQIFEEVAEQINAGALDNVIDGDGVITRATVTKGG
jgi:hypothetical protein